MVKYITKLHVTYDVEVASKFQASFCTVMLKNNFIWPCTVWIFCSPRTSLIYKIWNSNDLIKSYSQGTRGPTHLEASWEIYNPRNHVPTCNFNWTPILFLPFLSVVSLYRSMWHGCPLSLAFIVIGVCYLFWLASHCSVAPKQWLFPWILNFCLCLFCFQAVHSREHPQGNGFLCAQPSRVPKLG